MCTCFGERVIGPSSAFRTELIVRMKANSSLVHRLRQIQGRGTERNTGAIPLEPVLPITTGGPKQNSPTYPRKSNTKSMRRSFYVPDDLERNYFGFWKNNIHVDVNAIARAASQRALRIGPKRQKLDAKALRHPPDIE